MCEDERDRQPKAGGDGAGVRARLEEAAGDCDGQEEFAAFSIRSKEELFYLRKLAQVMDVHRVPHLQARAWISFSMDRYIDRLAAYAHHSL